MGRGHPHRRSGAWLLAASMAFWTAAAAQAPAPQLQAGNYLPANQDAAFQAAKARRDALLNGLTPVSEATLWKPADGDWLAWRRTNAALGHSPLKAINRSNVGRLAPA